MIKFNEKEVAPAPEREFVSENGRWIVTEYENPNSFRFSAKPVENCNAYPMGFGNTIEEACQSLSECIIQEIKDLTKLKALADVDFASEGGEHE